MGQCVVLMKNCVHLHHFNCASLSWTDGQSFTLPDVYRQPRVFNESHNRTSNMAALHYTTLLADTVNKRSSKSRIYFEDQKYHTSSLTGGLRNCMISVTKWRPTFMLMWPSLLQTLHCFAENNVILVTVMWAWCNMFCCFCGMHNLVYFALYLSVCVCAV